MQASYKMTLPGTICLLAAVLWLGPGCAGTADAEDPGVNRHRQVDTQSKRYAIHDQQLRETMLQLNALVSWSEQPSMPLDEDSKVFLQKLIDTVRLVAESASFLQEADSIEHLDEAQFTTYAKLAEQLYEEAVAIDMNARNMNLAEMNQAFLELNQTCIGCHTLFRGL